MSLATRKKAASFRLAAPYMAGLLRDVVRPLAGLVLGALDSQAHLFVRLPEMKPRMLWFCQSVALANEPSHPQKSRELSAGGTLYGGPTSRCGTSARRPRSW